MFKTPLARLFAPSARGKSRPRPARVVRPGVESLGDRVLPAAFFGTSEWAQWSNSPDMKVLAGDFNGDGRSDVMKFDVDPARTGPGGLWVGLSDRGGGFSTSEWGGGETSKQMKVLAGDFNGDGRTDVLKLGVSDSGTDAAGEVRVWLSTGSSFRAEKWADWWSNRNTVLQAGDFNGDGKTDIMKFDVAASGATATGGVWVGLSTGTGFKTERWADWTTRPQMKVAVGDFNGDGRSDIMKLDVTASNGDATMGAWVGLSTGGSFGTSDWARTDRPTGASFATAEWGRWASNANTKLLAADFNGDGRTDIAKVDVAANGVTSTQAVSVGVSTGGGFNLTRWANWTTYNDAKFLAGDYNGDGRADLMKFDVNAGAAYSTGALSVGLSTGTALSTTEWARWQTNRPMHVLGGDFDGNGQSDVMKFDVNSTGYSPGGLWVGLGDNGPVALGGISSVDWIVGRPNQSTIPISGGDGRYTVTSPNLPAGVTAVVSGSTIVLSGTAPPGLRFFDLTVRDGHGLTATRGYSLNSRLGLDTGPLASATAGQAYAATFNAWGGAGGYTFTVESGILPTGISLSAGGRLAGTSTVAGRYGFTLRVTDAAGVSRSAPYSLTVQPGAMASLSLSASTQAGRVGDRITLTVTARDVYNNVTTLPAGLTLNSSNGSIVRGGDLTASGSSFSTDLTLDGSGIVTLSFSGGGRTTNPVTVTVAAAPPVVTPTTYRYTFTQVAVNPAGQEILTREFYIDALNDTEAEVKMSQADAAWSQAIWSQYRQLNSVTHSNVRKRAL